MNRFMVILMSHSPREGVLRYQDRLCEPNNDDLINWIPEESHGSR